MTTAPEAAPEGEAGGWVLSVPPELVESWPAGPEEGCAGLAELPPDLLDGVGCPVEEEPAWVASWLQDEAQGCDDQDERGHLPSEVLAGVEPGLFLAAELESTAVREVDEYHLVEVVAGYQRMAAWAQWQMTQVAAHLSRRPGLNASGWRPGGQYVLDVTADELASRLGLSRHAAGRLVANGRLFALKLEDTGAALREGRIDYPKACVVARLLGDQPDDVAWAVQQEVLPQASHQTVTQLERAIARAIISIDPHRATARARAARERRRVGRPRVLPDGMASIFAVLPVTDAAGLDLALDAAARTAKAAGDSRTLEQLRADALALLGHGALEHGFIGVPAADTTEQPQAPTDMANGTAAGQDAEPGLRAAGEGVGRHEAAVGEESSASSADDDGTPRAAAADEDGGLHEAPGTDDDGSPADNDNAAVDDNPADEPARADEVDPALHTGNAFLRTPCMPVGHIGGRRAQISVVVPLSVLIAAELLDDGAGGGGDSCASSRPSAPSGSPQGGEQVEDEGFPTDWWHGPPVEVAELEGYGPIIPDVARALAFSGGTWRRLVTDPLSGELLDVGRTRYRPPAGMAEFVRHRDRTCVRPGCSCAARTSELDHVVPWEFGGVTSAENLGAMCGGDHRAKTVGATALRHLGGGTFQWTSPTGHEYLRHRSGRITLLGRGAHVNAHRPARAQFSDQPPF